MCDFLNIVSRFFPLYIENAEWNGDSLVVSGEGWSFSTNSAWRVSRGKKLLFACWDSEINNFLEELVGVSIVEVVWLISDQPIDPSLILSDGRRLDVFCTSHYEPWLMSLPEMVYVGGFAEEQ